MSPIRQELFDRLAEICHLRPELRIGQLIINLTHMVRPAGHDAIWDVEDQELLDAANRLLTAEQQKHPAVA